MSKYHNDETFASLPGRLPLSESKLRELEPALFDNRMFKCSPTCAADHPAREMRERIAEHMELGLAEPAIVVSTSPLIIAVLTCDIDAAVLLRFPDWLVSRYRLEVGTRLLTVNTYGDVRGSIHNDLWYAVDLIPGLDRRAWSNIFPIIAEFVSDDDAGIAQRKREIEPQEWTRLEALAKARIARWGTKTARDGMPSRAQFPAWSHGGEHFQPIAYFEATPLRAFFKQYSAIWGGVLFVALVYLLRALF